MFPLTEMLSQRQYYIYTLHDQTLGTRRNLHHLNLSITRNHQHARLCRISSNIRSEARQASEKIHHRSVYASGTRVSAILPRQTRGAVRSVPVKWYCM